MWKLLTGDEECLKLNNINKTYKLFLYNDNNYYMSIP